MSKPEARRHFAEGLFISEAAPAFQLHLPAAFHYLGQTAFILDGHAALDRHHCVDAPG